MVLIGFNYLETPGKQISLLEKEKEKEKKNFFKRERQENDGFEGEKWLIHVFEQ